MAVLTKSVAIGADWKEVTAAAGMANGSNYAIEVQDKAGTGQGHVIAVDTDNNAAPPADARGHQYFPRTAAGGPTERLFTKAAGRYWWMRSPGGEAMFLVVTAA